MSWKIVNVTLCSVPYKALSYIWSRERAPVPILCGEGILGITDHALRHLRLTSASRRLWVDALCIDQENVEERARQGSYIRLVYKHAELVIV